MTAFPMNTAHVTLSGRQAECLEWAARGKTSKETAVILGVTERTVNFHLYEAFWRLDVRSKPAAVAQALLRGLILVPGAGPRPDRGQASGETCCPQCVAAASRQQRR